MAAMFDEDVTRLCGPDGRHNADRAGYRHGTGDGSVTLGGRRVPVTRPRVRAADGSGELRLASYDLFSSAGILGQLAMEKILAGLSSCRYRDGLEPVGSGIAARAGATSKSAVSRRFVAATETALAALMSRRLDDLDLVAFLVDGVHFGEHCCVVALGINIDGTKYPLSLAEGSTENKTLVTGLITDLRDRGLDVTRPVGTVALADRSGRETGWVTSSGRSSVFAGVRFPQEVIAVAVRWCLRYGLSYRDAGELLAERGITVDHVTIYRWVQRFTVEFIGAARPCRHVPGDRWFADETYVKVAGRWT